jgi:hypothetical protein
MIIWITVLLALRETLANKGEKPTDFVQLDT